jgi:hypothetical protein
MVLRYTEQDVSVAAWSASCMQQSCSDKALHGTAVLPLMPCSSSSNCFVSTSTETNSSHSTACYDRATGQLQRFAESEVAICCALGWPFSKLDSFPQAPAYCCHKLLFDCTCI